MNIESIWAEIEQEQQWRVDEMRFFDNQATRLNTAEQERFRRASVLMLYSHYEGFCKFVFNVYVNAINNEGLVAASVNFSLVAASLDSIFKELKNPSSKAVEFRNSSPDDKKLHSFARDKAFLERSSEFERRIIVIPDDVVDTESNLKPVVLRKNLFRLGFPYDGLRSVEGDIQRLLSIRNEIAHGASGRGVPLEEYEILRTAAFKVMNEVKRYIIGALRNNEYLRQAS